MTGRARTTARGRARSREQEEQEAPGVPRAPESAAVSKPIQWQQIPRPLREEGPVVRPRQPRGEEVAAQSRGAKEPGLEAGLQTLSLQETRIGGVFQDLVVNTRRDMMHVKNSKTGSEGKVVQLIANHFRVISYPQGVAFKYNVDYKPDVEAGNLRQILLNQHIRKFGECHIFDGNSLLLPRPLRERKVEWVSTTEDKKIVKIVVEFSKELKPTSPDCLRFYNILFRKTFKELNLKQIGRHYYTKKIPLTEHRGTRLEIWRGYVTSILQYENSITLCADVNHKLLRIETVYDFISKIQAETDPENCKEEVAKRLIGSIVLTKYNNRTYRVDGIDWGQSPLDTFNKSDGTKITYIDYYKQQHKEIITVMTQPLLVSQGRWKKGQTDTQRRRILLIPQLCYMTGLTDEIRKDYTSMKDLAVKTKLSPERRHDALKEFMKSMKEEKAQALLRLWDFKFDSNLLSLQGRVLSNANIFQGRRMVQANASGEWAREVRGIPLLSPVPLHSWLLLYGRHCFAQAMTLEEHLRHVTAPMGITMRSAIMIEVAGDANSYTDILKKYTRSALQMVICILPTDDKRTYDHIKKYLCTTFPIPSQCVVKRTIEKVQARTIITKIAQQMNCKMGGALWKVETNVQRTMFIGIDCFHDIVNRQKSIAGFVASTNTELTKWYSECVIQDTGEELVKELRTCLKAALDVWCENESSMPRSIIVYRDGVGDGQLQALLDREARQMSTYLQAISNNFTLAFIVVKKRINTRFFLKRGSYFENPRPGTVIDLELTRSEWYDFFIVSQSVSEGTVTPTHYNVIYDTIGLRPDTVQRLTYCLCHMYYNLPGTIRVPAPCHYAHKLAYLVGQSICEKPNRSLSTLLFYL
ncbi:piwi-like protein 3 [Saimiri boliviensis]|uniref:piwi-like protein 3 n=1 Tax=Saimiri boliviensis TaxID=27679 RepID=UPI000533FCF2|nr:piwi-like protein 3 [Saimiri boliviensis boliviensis]